MTQAPHSTLRPEITATLRPEIAAYLAEAKAKTAPDWHGELHDAARDWQRDPRKALSNVQCEEEGGWKPTTQRNKTKKGILRQIRDGKKGLVTADSFHRHLMDRIAASHPADGLAPTWATSATFKPKAKADAEAEPPT
jgi:hypothetical protein